MRRHLLDGHLAAALAPVDFVEHSLELRNTFVRGSLIQTPLPSIEAFKKAGKHLLGVGGIDNLLQVLLQSGRPSVLDLARLEICSSSFVFGHDSSLADHLEVQMKNADRHGSECSGATLLQ